MTSITIDLPDDLAKQAKQAGLLNNEHMLSLFREFLLLKSTDHLKPIFTAFRQKPVRSDELTPDELNMIIKSLK
jgi:hypothetical protein